MALLRLTRLLPPERCFTPHSRFSANAKTNSEIKVPIAKPDVLPLIFGLELWNFVTFGFETNIEHAHCIVSFYAQRSIAILMF